MRFIHAVVATLAVAWAVPVLAHGGGLNKCGCHFNRKTGVCHCHQDRGCGCACQPERCSKATEESPDITSDSSEAQSAIVLCSDSSDTHVRGYTKKDGTYVPDHYRTKANDTKQDNYSSKGNVNPYTGEKGTKDPYDDPLKTEKKKSDPYKL
jgi:hypothetical protein